MSFIYRFAVALISFAAVTAYAQTCQDIFDAALLQCEVTFDCLEGDTFCEGELQACKADAIFNFENCTDVQVVEIDIKPESDPNCFNLNGHGVIPVAVLGSENTGDRKH